MIKVLNVIGIIDAIVMIIMGVLVILGVLKSVGYIAITLAVLAFVGGMKLYYKKGRGYRWESYCHIICVCFCA